MNTLNLAEGRALAPSNDPVLTAVEEPGPPSPSRAPRRARSIRPRLVLADVEPPVSVQLTQALAGEFVAGLAVLACKVIADEQAANRRNVGPPPIL